MTSRAWCLVVLALALSCFVEGCRRERPMVWELGNDGFEQSFFRGEHIGPTYVRRKVFADHCVFGDFPDDDNQPLPLTSVPCGGVWKTTGGEYQLTCECRGN